MTAGANIFQALIDAGWEFSIRWEGGGFSICVWKPGWSTDNLYEARSCPQGKGETIGQAYENLQGAIVGANA